jgi:hypothetical protein
MVSSGLRGTGDRESAQAQQEKVNDNTHPPHTRLEGGASYEVALDLLIRRATHRLRLFERVLGRAYNSSRRYDLLRAFLLAGRANRLQIVVHDPANIVRDCPRVASLLRQFGNAVTIHETLPEARGVYDPFAVADEQHFVHRFHYADTRAVLALDDPEGARQCIERFDQILEASIPAVPATTLGL